MSLYLWAFLASDTFTEFSRSSVDDCAFLPFFYPAPFPLPYFRKNILGLPVIVMILVKLCWGMTLSGERMQQLVKSNTQEHLAPLPVLRAPSQMLLLSGGRCRSRLCSLVLSCPSAMLCWEPAVHRGWHRAVQYNWECCRLQRYHFPFKRAAGSAAHHTDVFLKCDCKLANGFGLWAKQAKYLQKCISF